MDEPEMPHDNDLLLERPLPSSPDAERFILGVIILDNSLMAQAVEFLQADDFYVPSNRHIFAAMLSLFARGSEIDPILIADELRRADMLESCGGMMFLTTLTNNVYHVTGIESHAKILRSKSLLRQLVKAASKITADALAEEEPAEAILESAGQSIFNIVLGNSASAGFTNIGVLAHEVVGKAFELQQQPRSVTGLSTGFADIDALTLGLQPGDYIVLAARPSVGKTALALMFAQNASIRRGARVAFFSLEMSKESLAARVVCSEADVDGQRFRGGFINPEEWDKIQDAEFVLANSKLLIDDTAAITTVRIKAKCMALEIERGPLDLIVVDYIQLMSNSAQRFESRQQEVSQISRELKALAKELNVPLMALSQLNRGPENRSDHRPQLSDLRESGSIEQDADVVMFIYREDMYRKADVISEPSNLAEIILAKQRNGPTGNVSLRFTKGTGRFTNLYHVSE
jgi:replicative DNA helicase